MNLVKDEKFYILSDYHCSLSTWKNSFCQILKLCRVNKVGQTAIVTDEPTQTELSAFRFDGSAESNKTQILFGLELTIFNI